jgi:hypothetical protein
MGFPSNSHLSILAESDFNTLVTSSGDELDGEASSLFLDMSLSALFLSQSTANMLDSTSTTASCM